MDMRTSRYPAILIWLLVIFSTSESRPNASTTKTKRMAHMIVRHDELLKSDGSPVPEKMNLDLANPASLMLGESKTKAMKELLDVLGLQAPASLAQFALNEKTKKPPKYMVDLYNAIADHNGITRAPGLLDADTVRSIPNIDSRAPKYCKFDLGAVTEKEIILDAELHLFQSRRSVLNVNEASSLHFRRRGTTGSSYLVKVYQLMSEGNSTNPVKKLISARRLHSYHSGWHIFPILPTVESWMSDQAKNFGLMTEIISETGEVIENIPERESLRPIMVVFTNNTQTTKSDPKEEKSTSGSHGKSSKTSQDAQEEYDDLNEEDQKGDRRKRSMDDTTRSENDKRSQQDKKSKKNRNKRVNRVKVTKVEEEVTQDDIDYDDRIMTAEEYTYTYGQPGNTQGWRNDGTTWDSYANQRETVDSEVFDYASDGAMKSNPQDGALSTSNSHTSFQQKPYSSFTSLTNPESSMRSCRRYPMYVDFEEMGWSGWIIHPQGYNAYHCRGVCSFPLAQHLNPSNHATVQSIMHTLGLGNQPVEMPCCAPDKLYDINLLYFDQNDYVVLRRYKEMVAASCACR